MILIRPQREPKAFTLIELLVVISIIALLIGILLPALGAARRSGYNARCLANLRQVVTGSIVYADSYDGYLPDGFTLGRKSFRIRPETFVPDDPEEIFWAGMGPETLGLAALLEDEGIMGGRNDAWVCPANSTFEKFGNTYSYPAYPGNQPLTQDEQVMFRYFATNAGAFTEPSQRGWAGDNIVLGPARPGFSNPHPIRTIPSDEQLSLHGNGGTGPGSNRQMSFLDGHVELLANKDE